MWAGFAMPRFTACHCIESSISISNQWKNKWVNESWVIKIYLSQQIQENAVHLWIATKNYQKLKKQKLLPWVRWLNLKPVSKSSIISYRNSAVKQKKQTNRKHKVQQSRVDERQCRLWEKKKAKTDFTSS